MFLQAKKGGVLFSRKRGTPTSFLQGILRQVITRIEESRGLPYNKPRKELTSDHIIKWIVPQERTWSFSGYLTCRARRFTEKRNTMNINFVNNINWWLNPSDLYSFEKVKTVRVHRSAH